MSLGVTALVPMRHGSERVPGKNTRRFAGRPLYHWIVDTLLSTPGIGAVVIDTDSPPILEEAPRVFPSVRVIERPAALGGGTVPMNDVIAHVLAEVGGEWFLQTHATNPLLGSHTIARALELFDQVVGPHDSMFSVTRLQARLWDAAGKPINHDPAVLLRTQDLAPVFEENSCFYVFSRTGFDASGSRIGQRPLLHPIDRREAIDLDEEADFALAEALFASRGRR